ncbi:hypothetical protein A3A93_02600 [Candidatus Roizmanbacteria bacterium RIFCSPLOWO2_01_FULL_38_12]|uniref:Toxin YoeB n=1 Tax=Candidatus Roizmanbacteria bacterium RIFCSPLOWO2_01_FULL_38_12 TaxID=1802061 RepID=A0A1F7IYP1_9BACT|nr:MAG: hypothetical protein A3F59_05265 [Candidatus Roizmanbacteria bacterium RIFCSPHIGHO2_12_FULL_38_13]OGK48478.1 MAG: hypothetical protein A3A93_02600 [Candidatus Roizmanbacteria bacterium RIFCSPLOWO2_01_FULL_38_12]
MEIRLSREIDQYLKKIKKKDKKLFKRIVKQFALFKIDPKHRSLRVHKLSGRLKNYWSISISKDIRIIYLLRREDEAYFFDIGTHDEVYRK